MERGTKKGRKKGGLEINIDNNGEAEKDETHQNHNPTK